MNIFNWFSNLFGFKPKPKYATLEGWINGCKTIDEASDYAWDNFFWEADVKAADEWQEPRKAFLALQSKNTPSDCDDYAVVFSEWFKAKNMEYWLVYVRSGTSAHAICVYKHKDYYWYISNGSIKGSFTTFNIAVKNTYLKTDYACYVNWNSQSQRYYYGRKIDL